jgi:uncharacterized protein YndB with AHSA1/START domain
MTTQDSGSWQTAPTQANGGPGWTPALEDPAREADHLPVLHMPGARTLVRDRWERLVTTIVIPAAPDVVWRALVDADALRLWLARCHGSPDELGVDCMLDFEDGEFFLLRSRVASPPADRHAGELRWTWRWLGIGQATTVSWRLERADGGTLVTATEEAVNPPADWQTWNGGGWPGILDQLAAYLRTGTEWRWPWRRMGPYAQVELAAPPFQAWDQLISPPAAKFWLQRMAGNITAGDTLTILMGDASGTVELIVSDLVDAGQAPPSFLPHLEFALRRKAWGNDVGGRLWIEPAGWGRSLLQVFHYGWEDLPGDLQLSERKILTSFWSGAMRRAAQLFTAPEMPGGPHSWS